VHIGSQYWLYNIILFPVRGLRISTDLLDFTDYNYHSRGPSFTYNSAENWQFLLVLL